MSDRRSSRPTPPGGGDGGDGSHPLLSLALAGMLDDVQAHSGAVYLLSETEPVLEMAVMAGLPRAGHPQPLLRDPDGRVHVLDLAGGPLLGIDAPTTAVPLPTGSVLVLYTDGLIEAPGVDLDDALAELAGRLERGTDQPLEVLADSLIGDCTTTPNRGDDMAVLLLRPQR
ncbi:PP2C family protein-serine/threonine phosphatase [Streptomyces xantholiticus]|uniref:PP2C family protein-serine/threonine phosphatase n=1 Tax=Streptomyces xantholiticus TaxID=68285 RepID=UPI00198511A8|nr:hypothetical protein GCM10010381_25440 [Streptomyces xantholiticus]